MNLNKLLAMLKPKPKPRPIYVGDVIVGYDDGLPNSVKLDVEKLAAALSPLKTIEDNISFLQMFAFDLARIGHFYTTKKVYADKAISCHYVACVGVSTGGAYLACRNRLEDWVDNVYTCYWLEIAQAQATNDLGLWKTIEGTATQLARYAVDYDADLDLPCAIGAVGTTIKGYDDVDYGTYPRTLPTPKITVTDTSIASGTLGLGGDHARYTPTSYWGSRNYWGNAWVPPSYAQLLNIASPVPEALAYFEMPIVGEGKLPKDQYGMIRPVSIWDDEDIKAQVNPFRVELPQEIVEVKKPVPKVVQQKVDVLRRKGWSEEEIMAFMPEAFPIERINRLAVTHTALIPTDSKGQPVDNTAIVRVYQSTPEYCHPIEKRIQAIKEMRGVKQLSREEAIDRALKLDDKLHIHDLVPCTKHDLGGKCFQEYRDWRIHTIGDKPEFADTDVRKRYVKEPKGW
jgi:hypothetical protein